MKKSYLISIFICYSIFSFAQQQNIPIPKPHQLKWHEAEMGAVFHYDLHVFDVSVTDKETTVSIRLRIIIYSTQLNLIQTNGWKPPKQPDVNSP